MTALDVQREDDVSTLAEVARVDATIASVEAELAAARATVRAHARAAARALIGGETPTSDVRDAVARIGELEAVLVALGSAASNVARSTSARRRNAATSLGWMPCTRPRR